MFENYFVPLGKPYTMKETYHLNGEVLPAMPVPHDCLIEKISVEDEWLVFAFEDDINRHDKENPVKENARSLVIRFHLADETYSLYKYRKPFLRFLGEGAFICLKPEKLFGMPAGNLEYVEHFVGYSSIVIKMFSQTEIVLEASVDAIEYEWLF